MGVGESGAHAGGDGDGVFEREFREVFLAHPAHNGADVFAVDVLHRDEVRPVHLTNVERLDDVRVRHRGGDASFVQQHLDERFVLVHRGKDALDDDEFFEPSRGTLEGEEDFRHASGRESSEQRVLAKLARKCFLRRRRNYPEVLLRLSIRLLRHRCGSLDSSGYGVHDANDGA